MPTIKEIGAEALRLMRSREKKNHYTQGSNRIYFFGKPEGREPGYSDCSSSIRACYKKAVGVDIGTNTAAQIQSPTLETVDIATGLYPNEAKLLPGDLLYFKGTDKSRPYMVGHVEVYAGPDTCWGHGSGVGPNKHALKAYCKNRGAAKGYIMAKRLKVQYATPTLAPAPPTASGTPTGTTTPPAGSTTPLPITATPLPSGIEITGTTVNIRTGPGTNHAIVKTAKCGEVYESVDTAAWFPIIVSGKICWISAQYAKPAKS